MYTFWNSFSNNPEIIENDYILSEVSQDKDNLMAPFTFKNATIIPLANFKITGVILSQKRYHIGKESKFSPVDFAMGWGPMASEHIYSKIKVSQRNRWFYWKTDKYPIPKKKIEKNCANMHIIPADDIIKKEVLKARQGNMVTFSGYLVRVVAEKWRWQSSLTRNDTGNHACEVVFVKDFKILK